MNTLSIFINEYASVSILSANVNYYLFETRHPVCQQGHRKKIICHFHTILKPNYAKSQEKMILILASYIKT